MKRVFCVFMIVLLTFASVVTANADYYEFEIRTSSDGSYNYRVFGGEYAELVSCMIKTTPETLTDEYYVPSVIDGYEVRVMGDSLYSHSGVPGKRVIIPQTITSIGKNCFDLYGDPDDDGNFYCDKAYKFLEEVEIPESVNYIGDYAFFANYSLKEITIPESVVYLGKSAVASCSKMEKADIKARITEIPEELFSSCISLKCINMPKNIKRVQKEAFRNCKALREICVDDYCHIEESAFRTDDTYIGGAPFFTLRLRASEDIVDTDSIYDYVVTHWATEYAYNEGVNAVFDMSDENQKYSLWTGCELTLNINGTAYDGWKSDNPKCVRVTSDGRLKMLCEGKANVYVKLKNGKVFKNCFSVMGSPYIDSEAADSALRIRKGKTARVKLYGRCRSIGNKYQDTKKAKFISGKKVDILRIKGLKKGKTTLIATVNKYCKIKIKVKVY